MAFTVYAAVAIAAAAAIYKYVSGLRSNIAKARKTGLVYLVVRKRSPHFARIMVWIWDDADTLG